MRPNPKMERYTTGTAQRLSVHSEAACRGDHCVIHNPSNHPMKDFPTHWRSDRGFMERICPHGVGHPDPDGVASVMRKLGPTAAKAMAVHGCCQNGCCGGTIPS